MEPFTVLLGTVDEARGFSAWVEAADHHAAIDAAASQAEAENIRLSGVVLWVASGHITDLSAQDH
jgi:hypothetical protein